MKDKLGGFLGLAAIIGLIGLGVYSSSSSSTPAVESAEVEAAATVEPVCDIEEIPYEEIEEETEELEEGDSEVSQDGVVGEKEICENPDTYEVISETVIKQPVNQITRIGTYVAPTYSYRTGAVCNDGSYSYATGSGACSWHGGVYEWLYN